MSKLSDMFFGTTQNAQQVGNAPTMTESQRALLDQLTGILGGQLGQGSTPYQGSTAVRPTATQQNIFRLMQNLTSGSRVPQENQTAVNALGRVMQGSSVADFDPAATQQWYKDALVTPTMKTWTEEIAPAVREQFIGQNAGSSGAANRAISKSATDLLGGLDAQLANALYGERQTVADRQFDAGQNDLQRMLSVPNIANQTSQQPFDQLMTLLNTGMNTGAAEYGINQNLAQGDYQSWLQSQPYSNPWLNLIAPALGQTAFQPIVQGPTQSQGLMQMLGPVMQGWASNGFSMGG